MAALAAFLSLAGLPAAAYAGGASVSASAATSVVERSASTAAVGYGYSITVEKPAGTVPGDVLLAALDVRRQLKYVTAPLGWRLVRADVSSGAASTFTKAVYVKVADALEPSSYTWRFKYSAGAVGAILAYGGVDIGAPVDVHSGAFSASSSEVRAPSVTTRVPGALVVGLFGSSALGSFAAPDGMSERFDRSTGTSSYPTRGEGAQYVKSAAGATGEKVAQASSSASSSVGQLVALRPSGADPVPTTTPRRRPSPPASRSPRPVRRASLSPGTLRATTGASPATRSTAAERRSARPWARATRSAASRAGQPTRSPLRPTTRPATGRARGR